jgi:hypothetical protein
MKLANNEMLARLVALSAVKGATGKLGYAAARNRRKLMEEAQEYVDTRDKLLQQYGEIAPNGTVTLTVEAHQRIQKELEPLAGLESDVALVLVTPEELYASDLTSEQMEALLWMVEEGAGS